MRVYLSSSFVIVAAAAMAFAQGDAKPDRVISVTGTATVFAKADVARIHYGVRVSEPSADAVKDVLTKNNKAIGDAVDKLKLGKLTVTSAPMGIKHSSGNNPNLGGVPVAPGGAPAAGGLGPYLGYSSHTATIENADPDKLRADVEAFVKAITEAGANTGGGEVRDHNANFFPAQDMSDGPKIVLGRSDDSAARDEALQKAVEKAVRNAKAIAKGLGGGEVKVLSVTDQEPEKPAVEPLNIYGIESPNAPRIPAGMIEVKVRVVVKCSY